jgi:predicted lysophospholipase L1 biosynthesis ABC-type transport system permease subunit
LNRAVVEQRIEARVGIGLQDAFEIGQMRLRVNALVVGGVGERARIEEGTQPLPYRLR